jgi:hypothetical protein
MKRIRLSPDRERFREWREPPGRGAIGAKLAACAAVGSLFIAASASALPSFSTGAVGNYHACGVGPDLTATIPAARQVASIFSSTGYGPEISHWEDGNVWGGDFVDGSDLDPGGGSDATNIYFYAGHGICEAPPGNASDGDFIALCPNNTGGVFVADNIGNQSRWGNGGGQAQFMLLDASCPMDLASLGNQWFPPLQGLHIATGHSGSTAADTLESTRRGPDFVANIASSRSGFLWWAPQMSVGDAWMNNGIEDIQSGGCCAVAIAAGFSVADAIDRRDNEKISDGRSNPPGNTAWAWRWSCL